MNWKKALQFSVLAWVVVLIIAGIFVLLGLTPESTALKLMLTIISLVVIYFAAKRIAPTTPRYAIEYGLVFAVVGFILDFIITQRFAPDMFSSGYYWVCTVLIVFIPLLAVKKNSN